MGIALYQTKISPPVRGVLLAIKALGLDVELKEVDLMNGGHMDPEYVKMNPQHTVPTLDDNGFLIWDSHAINAYLVNKYGKTDALYPKEPQLRAVVDQRLHFDSGILFPRLKNTAFPVFRLGAKSFSEAATTDVVQAYELLDAIIGNNPWVAGDKMTIADFCCVSSISSLDSIVPGVEKCPNLSAWLKRCKAQMVGYQEANQEGVDIFCSLLKKKMAS